jgi:hypothetical protein
MKIIDLQQQMADVDLSSSLVVAVRACRNGSSCSGEMCGWALPTARKIVCRECVCGVWCYWCLGPWFVWWCLCLIVVAV